KYYSEKWEVTNEIAQSEPNSVSTSPNGKYENNAEINLYLYPFMIGILSGVNTLVTQELVFDQIVMVHKLDSVVVDLSQDMKNRETSKSFSIEDYEQWADGELTKEDWVNSRVDLVPSDVSNQYLFSRLRLKSNGIVNDLGWYVDNINLLPKTITNVQ